jgi:UDP-glucose 4-epimerase
VMDIADAHVRALDYLLRGGASSVGNLANARGYSVSEVIKTAERVSRRSIRTQIAPRRAGNPPVLIGLADRARAILGWSPQRSDLETQITDAWNWLNQGKK